MTVQTSEKSEMECNGDEAYFVWPWRGIVVNLPIEGNNGQYAGGSRLKEQLAQKGFNPRRVRPLWNSWGFSGITIVEFDKDWAGFNNAMSFEKAFEADCHGKKDWHVKGDRGSGMYAWVARKDDYNSSGIIAKDLRKNGNLKTVADIEAEDNRKLQKLKSNLMEAVETKKKHLKEMECKFNETSTSLSKLMEENDKLHQTYNDEIRKMQWSAQEHFQKICHEHEKRKLELEAQKEELEHQGKELEKREAQNENERRKLYEDKEKNAMISNSIQMATLEQKKADESVLRLVEDQRRQKEDLHKKIIQLENKLATKQALELEIEQLKGNLNVMKHMGGDEDTEVQQKMKAMSKDLEEKEGELEDLEALSQTLIVRERKSNDELQEARKELINGLKESSNKAIIGVKKMGDLDNKPFHDASKRKFSAEEADVKALELCSLWGDDYLRDPKWHPFKIIQVNGKDQEIINEEDEKLKNLRDDLGDEVYKAVVTALMEMNEYNPSGRYPISELWNFREGKKAALKEGITVILNQWKKCKRKK